MKKFYTLILFIFVLIGISNRSFSQCAGWSNFQNTDSIFFNPFFAIGLSPEADRLNRPYVYLATNIGGVRVYNINGTGTPTLSATIPTSALGNLNAINLYQDSIWLYVVLGDIWDTTQMAGLAIVNVSNPAAPTVLDYYIHPGLKGGAGAVAVRGNYAYLAGNQNGLIILDISNKSNIVFKSSLLLSNSFPHSSSLPTSKFNARGIDLKGNNAFVCYDIGGLRVVDISNVMAPVQINQYCYAPLIDKATAYNNIVIHNNLAYVALDYYGMEILDISNPSNISQISWWHPTIWADTTNDFLIWSGSKGHANELAYDSVCQKIYLAAGKSDLVSVDVSNAAFPTTCETYGSVADDYGTWGLDLYNGVVNVAYIWSVAFPPYSNYTGFKRFQTVCSGTSIIDGSELSNMNVFPNPTSGSIHIQNGGKRIESVKLYSLRGELLQEYFSADFSIENFPNGMYFVELKMDQTIQMAKVVKQ